MNDKFANKWLASAFLAASMTTSQVLAQKGGFSGWVLKTTPYTKHTAPTQLIKNVPWNTFVDTAIEMGTTISQDNSLSNTINMASVIDEAKTDLHDLLNGVIETKKAICGTVIVSFNTAGLSPHQSIMRPQIWHSVFNLNGPLQKDGDIPVQMDFRQIHADSKYAFTGQDRLMSAHNLAIVTNTGTPNVTFVINTYDNKKECITQAGIYPPTEPI